LILSSCSGGDHGCVTGKAMKTTAMESSSEKYDHSDDYGGCAGPPPPPDNIKPSSEELWFNAEGGVDSITTNLGNYTMSH